MYKKQLYTALSHTTNFDHILLDKKLFNKCYINWRIPDLELVNAK